MSWPKFKQVRAFVVGGGGADYHDQGSGHWIDDHIASPLSRYPRYRQSRRSFGINVLGTLVVEVEAEDGSVGVAVTTGGEPAAYIVEKHLARFDYMRSKIPTGRLGELSESVAMACFMASEECSFTTGSTFDTSGGRPTY